MIAAALYGIALLALAVWLGRYATSPRPNAKTRAQRLAAAHRFKHPDEVIASMRERGLL